MTALWHEVIIGTCRISPVLTVLRPPANTIASCRAREGPKLTEVQAAKACQCDLLTDLPLLQRDGSGMTLTR